LSEETENIEELLRKSREKIGMIYPVIKDQHGNILDGKHRKQADPNWKEVTIEVKNPLEALLVRVHSNLFKREIPFEEKCQWVTEARKLLQKQGKKGTQQEIAELLGVSREWVSDYDLREGFVREQKLVNFTKIGKGTIPETPAETKTETEQIPILEEPTEEKAKAKAEEEKPIVWSHIGTKPLKFDLEGSGVIYCSECGKPFRLLHVIRGRRIYHTFEEVKKQ